MKAIMIIKIPRE